MSLKRSYNKGSAPFVPRDLSGCRLWLRADRGVLSDVNGVSQWTDLSGLGNHFTQSVNANKPTLNATRFGAGRPGVDMIGTLWLEGDTLATLFGSASNPATTMMFVGKKLANTTNYVFAAGLSSSDTPAHYMNYLSSYSSFRRNAAGTSETTAGVENNTNLHTIFCVWDGNQQLTTDVDGAITLGTPAAIGNVTFNRCTLGAWRRLTPSTGANLAFGEVAAWNRALSVAERTKLRAYVTARGLA